MTTILVIDPGSRQKKATLDVRGTGWASMCIYDEGDYPALIETGLLPGGTSVLIDSLLDKDTPIGFAFDVADLVIVENFRLLEVRASIEPLEMVGVVRGICAAAGKGCRVQEPADRTLVSHDDLKRVGMWPGGAGHADEAQAVRHGLTWAMKSGNRPTIELLAPDPDEAPGSDDRSGPSAW